ncbi:MAG: MmgE/PrpD family protein, partial [Alphaproteobacteria bacterium]|nr:MmgE/PrpD family protein [Alphaproteobacteria bacterium]
LGRGPDNPLPEEALLDKFTDCAGRALPPARIEPLKRLLLQLDEAPSLRAVTAALAAAN